jgi:branched-chain amino acid transport system substrate-binding protein
MKRILFIILITFQCVIVQSQSVSLDELNRALELYSLGRYSEVVNVLKESNDTRSILIAAKSHIALGNFSNATILARSLLPDSSSVIKAEAQLVLAVSLFHQRDYSGALNTIDQLLLSDYDEAPKIYSQATEFKNELLNSLSYRHILDIIGKVHQDRTRRTLVSDYFHRYPRELAAQLIDQLNKFDSDFNASALKSNLQLVANYAVLPAKSYYVTGSIVNIGILLPSFESDASNRSISRGVYNGVLVAVDEYNRNHSNRKVQLFFLEAEHLLRLSSDQSYRELKSLGIDVIIGPLFSDQVREVSDLARRLGIPVLAPLANTFQRTDQMDQVFQVNPSFESRGESTARIAYEKLNLRRIGVMAESGTYGEDEANAFIKLFKELGGEVPKQFILNFAEMGYYVGDYTPWFANNQALVDSTQFVIDTLDAVYLPFTGEVAETLLNLTLTGLEAYRPNYILLGNDEMAYINHSSDRLRKLNLMYTGNSYLNESSLEVQNFKLDYLNRAGIDPNTFSFLGYDIANYFLWAIDLIGNPDDFLIFSEALGPFNGISNSIYFGQNRNNQLLHLFEVTPEGSRIVEFDP